MKREDVGLFCLLGAVFFAIVAAGHVQIDALPESGAALGLLLTLLACLAAGWAILAFQKTEGPVVPSIVLFTAAALIVIDPLQGGAMFTTLRVFVAVLVLGGVAWTVGTNRVVQMPSAVYAGSLALLVSALGISIAVSEFRTVSIGAFLDWVIYAAALYLAVATLGRIKGPRALLETITAAAGVVALKGVYEFSVMRSLDPTHRIFADYNNPNALAGMLAMALPLALALACINKGPRRILNWAAAMAMIAALHLTKSTGGLLSAAIGVVAVIVLLLAWHGGKKVALLAVPFVAGAAFAGLLTVTTPQRAGQTPPAEQQAALAPIKNEQAGSAQYRVLLWKGAVQLIKQQPVGMGVGTYRFYSARSGLNEQTHLTHQTYLQVALEGGAIAILGLVALGVSWTIRMFVGARALDDQRNLLRAGVFAAVAAAGSNALFESNLFYFATGLVFFVLLGTGLQLAADGTSPESLPKGLRATVVVAFCGLPLIAALWAMYLENAKSDLLAALEKGDSAQIRDAESSLRSIAGYDGEAWYLLGWMFPATAEQRMEGYRKAVAFAPTSRHLRALAQAQRDLGQRQDALHTLDRALKDDPNNLRTLLLKMQIEDEDGAKEAAKDTARQLIAVEGTPYMQTRALAELVPTETYDARLYLAKHTEDSQERSRLLREAIDGFLRYKAITVPKVLEFAKANLNFLSETRAIAEEKLARARDAARELEQIYSSSGNAPAADEVRALSARLTLD